MVSLTTVTVRIGPMEWILWIFVPLRKMFRSPPTQHVRTDYDVAELVARFNEQQSQSHERHTEDIQRVYARLDECEVRCQKRDEQLQEMHDDRNRLWKEIAGLQRLIVNLEAEKLEGQITINSKGVIVEADESAAALTGYGVTELMGNPVSRLIPLEYRSKHEHAMADVLNKEKPMRTEPLEGAMHTKDGRKLMIRIKLYEWCSDGERFFGAVIKPRNT